MLTSERKVQILEKYYVDHGWRIQPFTITYIEDANPNTWKPTQNVVNAWNDVRILWRCKEQKLIVSCQATTEPGTKAVRNRMNRNGTFHLLRDRMFTDCWEIGRHITKFSDQEALIQCDNLLGTRDDNEDFLTVGDKVFDDASGVNQHTTANKNRLDRIPDVVDTFSYGCLVGRVPRTHYQIFMPALVDSGQQKFDTVVLSGDIFYQWMKDNNLI